MKLLEIAVAVVFSLCVVEARGQWPLGTFGYGSYYAPGMYANDTRQPYFALNPPVYYSYAVPRPYGYSPFPYPGYVETPHVPAAEPQTLMNPYFLDAPTEPKSPTDALPTPKSVPTPAPAKSSSLHKQASAKRPAAPQPLRIVNPYFDGIAAGVAK
jgi:hypothetical protein